MAKATVRLAADGASGTPGPLTTLTDAEGRFQFSGEQPGRYRLSAERAGFLKAEHGSRRPGAAIPLEPPSTVGDLDIQLTPPGSISGQVFDHEGEPLARVPVQVLTRQFRRGRGLWVPVTVDRTNDRGEYRAYGLQPARYVVLVQALSPAAPGDDARSRGREPEMAYGTQYYPNGTELAQAQIIDLPPGAELRGFDLSLRKTRVFRIRGKVELPAGWQGEKPTLLLASAAGMARVSMPVREDGSFGLRDLAPGSYLLAARAEGSGPPLLAQTALTITDHDLEDVLLPLGSGVAVTGRVQLPESSGPHKLVVNVQLTAADGMLLPGASAMADPEGTFAMSNVLPGRYRLEASVNDKAAYLKTAALNGSDVLDKEFDITGPSSLALVIAADAGAITGEVRGKDTPVAGAAVVLAPVGARRAQPGYFRFATSGRDGRFTVEGVVPGEYAALAFRDADPNECYDPEFLKRHESKAVRATAGRLGVPALQLEALEVAEAPLQ